MHKNKLFYQKTIQLKGKEIGGAKPLVMGIINITPDSFYSESRKQSENEILSSVEKMIFDGADIIDLGAYSSRPQSIDISIDEEWKRLEHIIPLIVKNFPNSIISVDTFRADIAEKALDSGVDMINDISGGSLDAKMFPLIAKRNCAYVLMHMKGTPQTMQELNQYNNLTQDIFEYFEEKISLLQSLNFHKIIIDPGFGFAKNISQNFELLANINQFESLGIPLLIGISRKSMIYKSLSITAEESLNGTTALNMYSLEKGAKVLRVHDVKEAVECVKLWQLLNQQS